MQLLDRYLTAVKFWLPKKQREDIAAELAANLQSEIDDRVAQLGRPLTDDEIATLLKQHGAPILVASRYQQETRTVSFGRQIIGPLLFPFYWTAMKVTLVLLLIPATVPALVLSPHLNPAREIAQVLYRTMALALPALFLVTAIFALIDASLRKFHLLEKWQSDWDPRTLPSPAHQAKQVRRSSSIAGIIIQSLFILWWWNHGSIPFLVLNDSGARIHFAPVLTALHLPILIIAFIHLAQHWINLAEPDWRWLPPATGVITSVIALVVLFPLLGSSPLISISEANGFPIKPAEAAQIQNIIAIGLTWLWIGIVVGGAIYAWRLVSILWQMLPRPSSGATKNGMARI
ncbi:MAG: hypothetical protein WCE51_01520 [Chthoniobacterales bacterium]|jgi:hypothetical protein